jgi:hypothetical protein
MWFLMRKYSDKHHGYLGNNTVNNHYFVKVKSSGLTSVVVTLAHTFGLDGSFEFRILMRILLGLVSTKGGSSSLIPSSYVKLERYSSVMDISYSRNTQNH